MGILKRGKGEREKGKKEEIFLPLVPLVLLVLLVPHSDTPPLPLLPRWT
jgi:Na+-transporting methylmalonyl-CoA/oxaloacetate decarboxylase beta subunit